ncbi:MAG: hypothetical protein IJ586_08320 [Alloprevotella sp.]|nr:hypothetical protein [Alloprevotella sp.]
MKKYIIPAAEVLSLTQSEMLCVSGSVVIEPGSEVESGFSRGWDASDWTNNGEEE